MTAITLVSVPKKHGGKPGVYSGRTNAIIAELNRRWPCQEIPHGGLSDVARQFSVTRERVRQIANQEGIGRHWKKDHRPIRLCANGCGEAASGSSEFCKEHQFFDLPCAACGKPKRVAAHEYTARFRNPKRGLRTERVFCDNRCKGVWLGTHHGFGGRNPDQPKG